MYLVEGYYHHFKDLYYLNEYPIYYFQVVFFITVIGFFNMWNNKYRL